jgi:polyphosphate kinase 2 (PPK2 family)
MQHALQHIDADFGKYWFSITDEVQHLRFKVPIESPLKQWKRSPMDL